MVQGFQQAGPRLGSGDSSSGDLLPKSPGLPGSLQPERKRCGKPGCRCTRDELHGPYWYRRWREEGKQRKAFVRRGQLPEVQAALARWRQLHPPAWPLRQALAELRQRAKEVQRWQT
jgi:hypothetical protein